jgi:sugar porter (SP) family MFS transporter
MLKPGVVQRSVGVRVGAKSRDVEEACPADLAPAHDSSLLRVLPFVLLASLGALLFGYHLGVVNAALVPLSAELAISSASVQGAVVSAVLAGACVGSFAGGPLADAVGRVRTLRLAALPLGIGALLCGLAQSAGPLLLGRLVCGVGLGVASTVCPLYISEIAPPAHRGVLGSANQLCICLGILGALLAGLPLAAHPGAWRSMFNVAALPALALFVLAPLAPDSPAWLLRVGRQDEARAAAARLWGSAEALAAGGEGCEGAAAWRDLVSPAHARATVVAAGLFVVQQFAGINAVVYFSNSVFRAAGLGSDTLASAAVGVVNVVGTAVAARSLDRAGRRPMLLASFAGMAAAMLLLSATLSLPLLAPIAAPLSLIGTLAYVAAFAAGAGPIPSLLVAELYPPQLRGKGQSVALLAHWVCNFAIGQGFLQAVQAVGVAAVYAFFASVCAAGVAFVALRVPETRSRSYEEVAAALAAL